MAGGRPPKLTEVKVLEGTYRKDRVLPEAAEPLRLASVPDPPDGLTPPAAIEWNIVAGWLQSIGQLATTDVTLLAAYCNEIALYWQYDEIVKEQGAVIRMYTDMGSLKSVITNPYATLRSTSLANALKMAGQFGLTPVMRSRITQKPAEKPKSKLDQLKAKRNG